MKQIHILIVDKIKIQLTRDYFFTDMGNNLCKERIERADNPKSSVDRVIGRCVQVNL